jgi:hypothetical protein
MDHEELAAEIEDIFNPELDEDYREWPQERLKKHHALDFTYMEDWLWEGATSHPNTRLWPAGEPGGELTRRHCQLGDRTERLDP